METQGELVGPEEGLFCLFGNLPHKKMKLTRNHDGVLWRYSNNPTDENWPYFSKHGIKYVLLYIYVLLWNKYYSQAFVWMVTHKGDAHRLEI